MIRKNKKKSRERKVKCLFNYVFRSFHPYNHLHMYKGSRLNYRFYMWHHFCIDLDFVRMVILLDLENLMFIHSQNTGSSIFYLFHNLSPYNHFCMYTNSHHYYHPCIVHCFDMGYFGECTAFLGKY